MESDPNIEKKRFWLSLVFPGIFILLIWLAWFVETMLHLDFAVYGIFPRKISGLKGILFAPFIHSGIRHLFDNTIPLFTLLAAIFYFYRDLALRILFLTWLMVGLWVWVAGREAYHIGASGLVYGFASFVFFSGVFRKNISLLAISMLVVFLYGSMVWGLFPIVPEISYESHMLGAIAGLMLAFHYRKYGPQRIKFAWELEEEDEEEDENEEEEKERNAGPDEGE